MYCTRCGKEIDYDAIVCNECLEKEKNAEAQCEAPRAEDVKAEPQYQEVPRYQYAEPAPAAPVYSANPRMLGFGKALTSAILGFVGWIFSYVALVVSAVSIEYDDAIIAGVLFLLVGIGLSVPALIFGIKSITLFKSCTRVGAAKPIPTLILGIVGLSFAALSLFFAFITLLILSAA